MNYNHFTIEYINAIKENLRIEINPEGKALFFPDYVKTDDILNLKTALDLIWAQSHTAIEVVRSKHDANTQSGLFGLVNELEVALRVGFLISDRIVLIDYLYERILSKKRFDEIDLVHLGAIATSIVNTLPLAIKGRVVIIPSPFIWNSETKKVIAEAATKALLTPSLMSLLNMLSITKLCKLHPYTIAESDEIYSSIIDSQIDTVDTIGRDGGTYAYQGILAALLSEKLLNNVEMRFALDVPIDHYVDIIAKNKDFYSDYLSKIISGGSIDSSENIENLKDEIIKGIEEKNNISFPILAKAATASAGISSAAIGLSGAFIHLSAAFLVAGGVLSLSSTLTGLISSKDKGKRPIINVFSNLQKY